MTKLTAYIDENRNYLGDSLIVLEQLTDDQFDVLQAVTEETGNADVGIDNHPVISHDTIADFDASRDTHWAERGARKASEIAGHKVVFYSHVQTRKGQHRRDIVVVQFDGFTVILT